MINRERILDEAHLKQLNYEGDYHDVMMMRLALSSLTLKVITMMGK